MKVFRRTCALALMVMMLLGFTATAFALPKGFKLSDSMPKTVECAVLTKTADFKAADGRTYILRRGATVTVTGIKKNTVSVVYKKVKGYMSVQDLVMTTCVKAYVSRDCYAYEYKRQKGPGDLGTDRLHARPVYGQKKRRHLDSLHQQKGLGAGLHQKGQSLYLTNPPPSGVKNGFLAPGGFFIPQPTSNARRIRMRNCYDRILPAENSPPSLNAKPKCSQRHSTLNSTMMTTT